MLIKKKNQFKFLSLKVLGFICLSSFFGLNAQQVVYARTISLETSYLGSRNELEDYILDTGDVLNIEFFNIPELSGSFRINEQGEIYLKRIKFTYIRGLTIKELTQLLEERYKEFLLNPEIYIRISTYKSIRVSVSGEVRAPGVIRLPAYISRDVGTYLDVVNNNQSSLDSVPNSSKINTNSSSLSLTTNKNVNGNSLINSNNLIKRSNDYITTLANAIQKAGGLTSYSDIGNLEVTREVPLGNGGGKKRAIVNFLSYIRNADASSDLRLFDGDNIFIPRLEEKDLTIIPQSILSGLSPRFVSVLVGGEIENPGTVKIPIEGSLSDAMNLTGPRNALSGKVDLIRYNKDGTLLRKNIRYSVNATPGSSRNPYLLDGDLITVKNSILGRSSGLLKAITEPFVGFYATKELFESISGN